MYALVIVSPITPEDPNQPSSSMVRCGRRLNAQNSSRKAVDLVTSFHAHLLHKTTQEFDISVLGGHNDNGVRLMFRSVTGMNGFVDIEVVYVLDGYATLERIKCALAQTVVRRFVHELANGVVDVEVEAGAACVSGTACDVDGAVAKCAK